MKKIPRSRKCSLSGGEEEERKRERAEAYEREIENSYAWRKLKSELLSFDADARDGTATSRILVMTRLLPSKTKEGPGLEKRGKRRREKRYEGSEEEMGR